MRNVPYFLFITLLRLVLVHSVHRISPRGDRGCPDHYREGQALDLTQGWEKLSENGGVAHFQ